MDRSKKNEGHLWDFFARLFRKFKPNFLKRKLEPGKGKAFQAEMESLINEFNGYQEFGAGYFNQKKAQVWLSKTVVVIEKGFDLLADFNFEPELMKKWKQFGSLCNDELQPRDSYNQTFVSHELTNFKNFFDKSGSNPLDDDQRRAVICDEDNTLVLAGAGSGKTAVIAAKVGYLVKCKKVDPGDILLLTFGKKAAEEMKRRVKDWYGIGDVECRTIHSLGYQIITRGSKKKPRMLEKDDALTRNSQGFLDFQIFKDL